MKLDIGLFIVTDKTEEWGRWIVSQVAGAQPFQVEDYFVIYSPLLVCFIGRTFKRLTNQKIDLIFYDKDLSDEELNLFGGIPHHYKELDEEVI